MAATLTGSNDKVVFDGKKTLTISNGYNTAIDVSKLTAAQFQTTAKDGNPTVATAKEFDANKITIIDATQAGQISIVGGAKASAISLGSAGGTIVGGNAADKMYGSTGADTFVLTGTKAGGNDQIGSTSSNGYGGTNDKIVFSNAKAEGLTFTDNVAKSNVVITTSDGAKYTVYKASADTPINIQGTGNTSITYGTDGTKSKNDGKTLTLTGHNTGDIVDASTLAAGVKSINATGETSAIWLIGNGQADAISLGSAGGTVSGGNAVTYKNGKATYKATADNLYGTTVSGAKVTFAFDSLSGNDAVYNYKKGDVIYISDGNKTSASDVLSSKKGFKDSGKDVTIPYNAGKISIKNNTASLVTINVNGSIQKYGVDFDNGLSVDSKKTALEVSSGYTKSNDSIGIEGWNNDGLWTANSTLDALQTYAPKLNTINASSATTKISLYGRASVASILKGGTNATTMTGGTAADQYYGGTGSDVFVFDASKTIGKDVINDYGAKDLIMVTNMTSDTKVSIDTKGAVYLSDNKNVQKANSITVKNFKTTTQAAPVVVVDSGGTILAVGSNAGTPGPIGMNSTSKAGLITDGTFTGLYNNTDYVKDAVVDLTNGTIKTNANTAKGLSAGHATIDAADYGGAVKAINASLVGSSMQELYIKGNASVKNTIYAPVFGADSNINNPVQVTLQGGTQADTFIGNTTSTKTRVTYLAEKGGKDVIQGYNSGDTIKLEGVTLSAGVLTGTVTSGNNYISEKGTDVTFNFDKSNNLTIKNAAGKAVTFVDATGEAYVYGHTLEEGLQYNSKHDAIEVADPTKITKNNYGSYVEIDLSEKSYFEVDENGAQIYVPNYYNTIKTINMSSNTSLASALTGSSIANELYAGTQGATLWGGKGAGMTKASADKLYGNVGSDTFIYHAGDGADVIGAKNVANSSLQANDTVLLGSSNTTVLKRSDVTISDKKEVVTIEFDKSNKLTINRDSASTGVKIYFTDSDSTIAEVWTLDGENGTETVAPYTDGATYDSLATREQYIIYGGVDDRKFAGDASGISSGLLVVSGAGSVYGGAKGTTRIKNTITPTKSDGTQETLGIAVVDINNVSSNLKNVNITADSTTVVSLVGGASALNISVGAGGGTIEGGYSVSNGKVKTLNDKIYFNTEGRGTTYVFSNATGGKDNIYNYDAAKGDVIYFKDGAPDTVKFSAKSIVFSYSSGNKGSLTINGTGFTSETSIAIAYGTVGAQSYFGWGKSTKFSDYISNTRNEYWTKPEANTYVYTGKTETFSSGDQETEVKLYGINYTLSGEGVVDANNNWEPDNVVIGQGGDDGNDYGLNTSVLGSIQIANDNPTLAYVDPAYDKFHIKGGKTTVTAASIGGGYVFTANGTQYTLANIDGNPDNGYELTYNGWAKVDSNTFVHFADGYASKATNSISSAQFTLTGAVTDAASPSSSEVNNNVFALLNYSNTTSGQSDVTITVADSSVTMADAHVIINGAASSGTEKFKLAQVYNFKTQLAAEDENTTPQTVATYKLYDGDGDMTNGYEFLRTDIATASNWSLNFNTSAKGSVQAAGSGIWSFNNDTLSFDIASAAGVTATANGLPDGISVGIVSEYEDDGVTPKTIVSGTTIYFTDANFDTANISLASSTKVDYYGTDSDSAVHFSGLNVGTGITIGAGDNATPYVLGQLDGDTDNGLELVRTNKEWTFDQGAWKYDNSASTSATIAPLSFTIDAKASLRAADDGTPEGVTVTADKSKGYSVITFATATDTESNHNGYGAGGWASILATAEENSDTKTNVASLITFENITTGDVQKTVHIQGFDSDTVFTISGGEYYLAELDTLSAESVKGYEFLPVNNNWKRTATGWEYYANGIANAVSVGSDENGDPTTETLPADLTIKDTVLADENGAPRGISVAGSQYTIDDSFGMSSLPTANGQAATVRAVIDADKLVFASTTAVNASGIHIIGTSYDTKTKKSLVSYDTNTTIALANEVGSTVGYKLAQLDRDSTNGFELLPQNSLGWSYSSGNYSSLWAEVAVGTKLGNTTANLPAQGTWTYATETKTATGATASITFQVSPDASLLPANAEVTIVGDDDTEEEVPTIKTGVPMGIFVSTPANGAGATIYADRSSVTSAQLIFDSVVAKGGFLSDTGLHIVGLNENDIVTVAANETVKSGTTTKIVDVTWQYRVKELNNSSAEVDPESGEITTPNAYELLKVSDTDVWSLTTGTISGIEGVNAETVRRTWTYSSGTMSAVINPYTYTISEGEDGAEETTYSGDGIGGLNAGTEGRPLNFDVVTGANGTATISINQDETDTSKAATLSPSSLVLTIPTDNLGSGTNVVHVVVDTDAKVYNTDTTLLVNGVNYRLSELDGDTANGYELIRSNDNWTYHSEGTGTDKGTWTYSKTYTVTADETSTEGSIDVTLGNDVAARGGVYSTTTGTNAFKAGVAPALADGSPDGVVISANDDGSNITITFDASKLNYRSYNSTTKVTTLNLFDHITLGDETPTNAGGVHVVGLDSNTTLSIGSEDFYLVDLDNNESNGLEIARANDNWVRTATGWHFRDNGKGYGFSVNTILEMNDDGSPHGISVVGGDDSDTITVAPLTAAGDSQSVWSGNITFDSDTNIKVDGTGTTAKAVLTGKLVGGGDNALHFLGFENGNTFTVATPVKSGTTDTYVYTLRELDGDTTTGLELLVNNSKGWSMVNGEDDNATERYWTYSSGTGTNTLTFAINPGDDRIDDGLVAGADGTPIGASVTAAAAGYFIDLGDTDTTKNDGSTVIDTDQLVFTAAPTGVYGVHIKGFEKHVDSSSSNDSDSFIYTTDADKMFDVNGNKYYLANVNTSTTITDAKAENYFELLYNDPNWHRNKEDWTYSATGLKFTIASDTTAGSAVDILTASTVNAGRPNEVSVSASGDDTIILFSSTAKANVASHLTFDSTTTVNGNLHISLNSANSSISTFEFGSKTEPSETVTYYIVNTDGNAANGKEFYMADNETDTGVWKRIEKGWQLFSTKDTDTTSPTDTNVKFSFLLNTEGDGKGQGAADAGQSVPSGITFDTDTNVITNEANSAFELSDIVLYNNNLLVGTDTTTDKAPHFLGFDAEEGTATVRSGASNVTVASATTITNSVTYYLYNADGDSTNGLELTYNGWLRSGESSDATYSYAKGQDSDKAKSVGFAIHGDTSVIKEGSTSYPSLPGFRYDYDGDALFAFNSSTAVASGIVISKLTSDNFHVAPNVQGSATVGSITAGTTKVVIGNNTYTLRDADGKTENGYELTTDMTSGYWKLVGAGEAQTGATFVYTKDSKFSMSLKGSYDNNYDFVPNAIRDISVIESATETDVNITLSSYNDAKGYQFSLRSGSENFEYKIIIDDEVTDYTLSKNDSNEYYSLEQKAEQLPAGGYADIVDSGYDVEDLFGDKTASISEIDELTEISEIKALATAESTTLDLGNLLTEVGTTDRSITLNTFARRKATK